MATVDALSLQYVKVPISAEEEGVPIDPTAGTVTMAFLATGTKPDTGDWKTADWETDATRTPARYKARCLVGPGGTVTLAAGTYVVWWKITGITPEVPIGTAEDRLTVT